MSDQVSSESRLTSAGATMALGVTFFFCGFLGIVEGDVGHSPVYHAGWMVFGSLLYMAIYFLFELAAPPRAPWAAPRIQYAFAGWMAIGSIFLCIVEARNSGECCSNPALSQIIANFSMLWPLAFCIPVLLTTFLVRRREKLDPGL